MFPDAPAWLQALLLGGLQGVTEFLPVSSSGHLALAPALLGWPQPTLTEAVVLHLGTLTAVCIVFARDLAAIVLSFLRSARTGRWDSYAGRDGFFICISVVPAALAGFFLRPRISELMARPEAAAIGLAATGLLLCLGELIAAVRERHRFIEEMNWVDALFMGLAQAAALLPGVSRSGATIAAARTRGLERPGAARFSFLMGVPAMLGAGLLEVSDFAADPAPLDSAVSNPLLISFAASVAAGMFAIRLLLRLVQKRGLWPFGLYCLAAALSFIFLVQPGA